MFSLGKELHGKEKDEGLMLNPFVFFSCIKARASLMDGNAELPMP